MPGLDRFQHGTLRIHRFDDRHSNKIEEMRTVFKRVLTEKEYEGYLDEYDRQFDPYSTFFVVYRNDGEIVGTTRLIDRTADNRLPLEMGLVKGSDLGLCIRKERPMAELTSFWFDSRSSLRALSTALADFGYERYDKVYATYDPELELDRLYKFLNFREIHPGLRLTYDGFTRKDKLVEWGIMAITQVGIVDLTERKRFSPDKMTLLDDAGESEPSEETVTS